MNRAFWLTRAAVQNSLQKAIKHYAATDLDLMRGGHSRSVSLIMNHLAKEKRIILVLLTLSSPQSESKMSASSLLRVEASLKSRL
jgi:hypothetical protein